MARKIFENPAIAKLRAGDGFYVVRDEALDYFATLPESIRSIMGVIDLFTGSIAVSVGSNALTIALKQADGTDPTADEPVYVSFRASTLTDGKQVIRAVTSALSLTIPSGATFGFTSAVADNIYVYLIDNAGTVELAASTEALWDEGLLWDTTVMNTSSDSRIVLYSASARSAVAVHAVTRLRVTEATAGTWATAPAVVAPLPFDQSGVVTGSASGVALSTGTDASICSIVVPPGKWRISGGCSFTPQTTTAITALTFGVSNTNNAMSGVASFGLPNATGECNQRIPILATTVTQGTTAPIGQPLQSYVENFDVATTLYFVMSANFSGGSLTARAWIQAQRVTR